MVGAERDEVFDIVGSSLGLVVDVVNLNKKLESTDGAKSAVCLARNRSPVRSSKVDSLELLSLPLLSTFFAAVNRTRLRRVWGRLDWCSAGSARHNDATPFWMIGRSSQGAPVFVTALRAAVSSLTNCCLRTSERILAMFARLGDSLFARFATHVVAGNKQSAWGGFFPAPAFT